MGRPLDSVLNYKKQLADAGFVNVVQTEYKWPTNPWPKERKHKNLGEELLHTTSAIVADG